MISRTELANRYKLTDRQVRRKLEALGPLLAGHTATGDRGKELYDDHAITLFDRLTQLESEGISTASAAERIINDLAPDLNHPRAGSGLPDANMPSQQLIDALRDQLENSRDEVEFLRDQIKQKDETLASLLPMLPGGARSQADSRQSDQQPDHTLTRWGHFIAAIRGN